ncbi:MAG: FHA domain-containing protein, partial [Chloroflexi bacterium]|nr:FHA domain-containing protein [Chloroflexota bacterium]
MSTINPSQHSYPMTCPHCGNTMPIDATFAQLEGNGSARDFWPASFTQQPKSASLELIVASSERCISLPLASLIYVGRRDERRSIYPDIDLAEDEGVRYGVSRQHACIHRCFDGGIYIEDLNSTNGTGVNGKRLHPLQTYPLHHGYVLRLGHLDLEVT